MLKLVTTMGRPVCSLIFSVSPIQPCRRQNPAVQDGRETEVPGKKEKMPAYSFLLQQLQQA